MKISKNFTDKYKKDPSFGVDCNFESSVMLDLNIDDTLKHKGIARELVNKVQRLRKDAKLNIDDHIEIFFEHSDKTVFNDVIGKNNDSIKTAVKVPFLPASTRQAHFIKIADTEYVNPEDASDVIKSTICVPSVTFNDAKLQEKFGHLNQEKVNFVNDVKSFVLAHSHEALKKKLADHNNTLKFKLND